MNICKGRACALHLTKEYKEGQFSLPRAENPYDFFDDYEKHYAWDIGNQEPITISGKRIKRRVN